MVPGHSVCLPLVRKSFLHQKGLSLDGALAGQATIPQPGPSILEEVAAFKKTKKIPHPYLASSSMGGLRKGAGTLHSWAPCYTQLLVKVSL